MCCQQPAFDVILADNLFGDLLSDQSAAIAGSLGMLPSALLLDSVQRAVVDHLESSQKRIEHDQIKMRIYHCDRL